MKSKAGMALAAALALIAGAGLAHARVLKDTTSPAPSAPSQGPARAAVGNGHSLPVAQAAGAGTRASAAPVRTVEPWAPDLRERVERVPASAVDASGRTLRGELPVTVFRPAGPGPFPLAIISHGRDWRVRASYERQRYESAARFFIRKGYAVAVPLRLGYGELASVGDPESTLSCDQPRFATALEAAADEIGAVLRFMAAQPDIDASRTVLVGQSVGGLASLAAAVRQVDIANAGNSRSSSFNSNSNSNSSASGSDSHGDVSSPSSASILAVINVSGGHGGRTEMPGNPCRPDLMKQALQSLAGPQRSQAHPVPTLWLYAENDRFFGARWPHQWAQAWADAGGAMTWRLLPPVGQDGHRLFTDANDRWQPLVDEFLQPLGVDLPGALPYPPDGDRGRADVDDPSALPPSTPELHRLYRDFLAAPLPRAFAMNGQSRSAYAYGDDAQSRALARCEEGAQAEEPCRLYAVNRTVVWSSP